MGSQFKSDTPLYYIAHTGKEVLMEELLKEKADELARLIKQDRVLSEEARLCQKMAEHAKNAYSLPELEFTTPEFRRRLTGRE